MPQQNTTRVEINAISNRLAHAAVVTLRLAEAGVTVLAAVDNGHGTVLMVDSWPAGIPRQTKRSHANAYGGTCVVDMADYHGCRIEYMHDVPGDWPPPARSREHLQAVPNG